jgi:hypothetical protein
LSNPLERTRSSNDLWHTRLNEIRMPAHERLAAEAHLASAEAITDLIVAAIRALQSVAKTLTARRLRRAFARIG